MPRYEVFIPAPSADLPDLTLRVDSENWLAALKLGLEKACGARMATNVLCDVKDGGAVEVTDPSTGKVFRIVELGGPAPAAPAPPAPAAARLAPPAPPPAPGRPIRMSESNSTAPTSPSP